MTVVVSAFRRTGAGSVLVSMRLIASVVLDLLVSAAVVVAVAIVLTGGWTFQVGAHNVRAHHPGNLLLIAGAITLVRLQVLREPILGVVSIQALDDRLRRSLGHVLAWLNEGGLRRAVIVGGVIAIASLLLKVYSATTHVGFLTGDDVEVHQMTFAALFHQDWAIWNVRSGFYPMTFIYPIQWLLHRVGVEDPWLLILGGRLAVATLSAVSVFLLFAVLRRPYGTPVAFLAAVFFGVSKLQLIYGASELPRPVASLFLIAAFGLIGDGRVRHVITGGCAIGAAAALRFSEIVFIVPALCQLLLGRRWRDSAVMLMSACATAAAIQATSDYLYWGQPFQSLHHIVEYTLVQRQSSRGFEPVWFYLTSTPDWTDMVLLGAVLFGATVAGARALLWMCLPVLILSLLPHKEPRYLVPVMPFIALVAGCGMWRWISGIIESSARASRLRAQAIVLVGCLLGSLLTNVNAAHFPRSEPEVRLAKVIAANPSVRGIAGDQLWRVGHRLYFMKQSVVVDIDPFRVGDAAYLRTVVTPEVDVVLIDSQNAKEQSPDATLQEQGFVRVHSAVIDTSGMAVFSRVGALH
jgi:hypothetical protein